MLSLAPFASEPNRDRSQTALVEVVEPDQAPDHRHCR